jgi:AraC family transcriptional regulator of adaptative response/methylated-DNA-[protein]-cysteine methyltransferase
LKRQLQKGTAVTAAMYETGFGSSSRLYEATGRELGMTPARYGRGGDGAHIRYTIADSPLGCLLVAVTERGICSVKLGDSVDALVTDLRREYARAAIDRDDRGLNDAVQAIVAHLAGSQPHLDLPTDVRATAFQRRVWLELRRIPYGTTRSYSDIARRIGDAAATRAVARACATNPVCLVVPCHRVVQKDGGLGGYRWGIERKRALIARERQGRESSAETVAPHERPRAEERHDYR